MGRVYHCRRVCLCSTAIDNNPVVLSEKKSLEIKEDTMLYHPDYIMYIWLFPVFFLLILPLSLTLIGFLLRLTRSSFLTGERVGKEKRKYPRFTLYEGTFAEISAGELTCTGLVCDISRLGISLKHLPDKFFDKMDKLKVVIRGYGVDHNLLIKPKWVSVTESGKQIGAEIDDAPSGWSQFLIQSNKMAS